MSARPIATVRAADGYAGILKAFRDRQAQLGLSGEEIDAMLLNAGNRTATKWLSGLQGLGPKSWGDALGAMAMKVVFLEDEAALRRLEKHRGTRNESQVRTIARIRVTKWLFTPRSARKAAKMRNAKMTKAQRVASAKKAINARWRRVREARRAARCSPTPSEVG